MTLPDEINFLPEDYRHRGVMRRTSIAGMAALLTVALTLAGAIQLTRLRLRLVENQHAETMRLYSQANSKARSQARFRDQQGEIVRRAALQLSLVDAVPRTLVL